MIDIMLDLETWGKKPGCDIRSIGATVFNRVTGVVGDADRPDKGQFYVAVDNPIVTAAANQIWRIYPLHRDADTVQWWSEQSAEAQAAFANPVDLRDSLIAFGDWYCRIADYETVSLWSHGPAFDPPILAAAYDAVGLSQPWHYRAPRDTRTILEAGGIDPHKGLEQFSTGIFHHALNDAQCQAAAVCEAFLRLRTNSDRIADAFHAGWNLALGSAWSTADEAYQHHRNNLKR